VDDFYVVHMGSAAHEGFDQRLRLGASGLNVYTHSRADTEECFLWRL
jgi:hypothetical protein